MHNLKTLVVILFIFSLINCKKESTPLEKVIIELKNSLSNKQLDEFAKKPDSIALKDIHFGYGINFRNQYLRDVKDSTLVKYFNSLDIYHEDYMSNIVFLSLHRELNEKPIGLENQLKLIYKTTKEIKRLKYKNYLRANKYLDNYKIGDTIFVRRPVDGGWNAVQYSYPDDSNWVFNDSLDLILKGVIVGQNKIVDSLEVFYKMKVLSKNNEKVKILMEEVNLNDTIEVDLRIDIIEDFY